VIYAWNFIVSVVQDTMKTLSSCIRFWYKLKYPFFSDPFLVYDFHQEEVWHAWLQVSESKRSSSSSVDCNCLFEGVCLMLIHFYSRFTFSVLVFPPVNNYRRFLIHKVSEKYPEELCTFSIGQGHGRRTVVCFKRDLLR